MTTTPITTSTTAMAPLLVSYREAGRLLGGLCEKSVYLLVKSGKIPAIRLSDQKNAHVKIDVADLQKFIASRKAQGPAPEVRP